MHKTLRRNARKNDRPTTHMYGRANPKRKFSLISMSRWFTSYLKAHSHKIPPLLVPSLPPELREILVGVPFYPQLFLSRMAITKISPLSPGASLSRFPTAKYRKVRG